MCGISLVFKNAPACIVEGVKKTIAARVGAAVPSVPQLAERLAWDEQSYHAAVACRGPTLRNGSTTIAVGDNASMTLRGSVLHLRGSQAAAQPCGWPTANPKLWLLWNGEVFGGVASEPLDAAVSDTHAIAQLLHACFDRYEKGAISTLAAFQRECLSLFEAIEGPFSTVVYFSAPVSQVWIGRDKIGRRSLCVHILSSAATTDVVIGSIGSVRAHAGFPWTTSFPVGGMLVVTLPADGDTTHSNAVGFLPWTVPPAYERDTFLSRGRTAVSPCASPARSIDEIVAQLEAVLAQAVRKRIQALPDHASVAMLFSGGLDSGILTALALRSLAPSHPLQLINVAFGTSCASAPDRYTAMATLIEVAALFQHHRVEMLCCNVSHASLMLHESRILEHIHPNNTHMDFNIGAALYFASCGKGFCLRPDFSSGENEEWWSAMREEHHQENCFQVKIPRSCRSTDNEEGPPSMCSACGVRRAKPDCSQSACRTCCRRRIQDAERQRAEPCDASQLKCSAHRHSASCLSSKAANAIPVPETCIYSSSVASAEEALCDSCSLSHTVPLRATDAAVLIVGHGADELFAGYGRHSTAARHTGAEGVRAEMIKDLKRLWERNLGRDDRCISCWGRETRHPFLDEQVIGFVAECPAEALLPTPEEDKTLLRRLARRLGLEQCSRFKKRAIQFGSRSARQTNLTYFASHRKANGLCVYDPRSSS